MAIIDLFKNVKYPQKFKIQCEKLEEINPGHEMYYNLIPFSHNFCKPAVKIGDEVKVFQKIGEPIDEHSVPVYSSVSGKVLNIIESYNSEGERVPTIVVDNDKHYLKLERETLKEFDLKVLVKSLKEYSYSDDQGNMMYKKYEFVNPEKISNIIINATKWDESGCIIPSLIDDKSLEILEAIKLIKSINVNVSITLVFNKNDHYHYDKLRTSENNITLRLVSKNYSSSMGKQLIEDTLGKNNYDNTIIEDFKNLIYIYQCMVLNEPAIEEILSITNTQMETKNYKVRIGTRIWDILEKLNIPEADIDKIVRNGLLTGKVLISSDVPIVQGTNSLAFIKYSKEIIERACIRCGKCIQVCPAKLYPVKLINDIKINNGKEFKKYKGEQCINCGLCSYVCPSRINLASKIFLEKELLVK